MSPNYVTSVRLMAVLTAMSLTACTKSAPADIHELVVAMPQCAAASAFTVSDEIAMRRLSDPDLELAAHGLAKFKKSPDGRHLLLVDRIASVQTGEIHSRLLLHDMEAIEAFARDEGLRPSPRILAEHVRGDTREHEAYESRTWNRMRNTAILQARWLDNETITYLGDKPGAARQLYAINIRTGRREKLTFNDLSLVDYALSAESDRFVFATSVPAQQPEFNKRHFLVGSRRLTYLRDYAQADDPMPWLQYFSSVRGDPTATQPVGAPFSGFALLNVSPNGTYAVSVMRPFKENSVELEDIFSRFPQLLEDAPYLSWGKSQFDPYYMHPIEAQVEQYQLIDLNTATMEPLFDAPKQMSGLQPLETLISWSPDGRQIAAANVYVEAPPTSQATSGVMVRDLITGETGLAISQSQLEHLNSRPVTNPALAWRDDETLEIALGHVTILLTKKSHGAWTVLETVSHQQEHPSVQAKEINLELSQSLSVPPRILVSAQGETDSKVLDFVAPRLSCRTLGRTVPFKWTSADGKDWEGGLVYPVGYDPKKTYGLVIQPSGYNRASFLIGGLRGAAGPTPPYSAQALANRDLFVLVLAPRPGGGRIELERMRASAGRASTSPTCWRSAKFNSPPPSHLIQVRFPSKS
jgi:dipeptidyl aminopeptidase/acylaminoacyl peptidase